MVVATDSIEVGDRDGCIGRGASDRVRQFSVRETEWERIPDRGREG